MTGTPWWYSGDESEEPTPPPPSEPADDAPRVGADWGSLLSGAQRIVDWATETVMAPHTEHDDPRQHPECVICRAIALVDLGRETGQSPAAPADEVEHEWRIEWIPIREDVPES